MHWLSHTRTISYEYVLAFGFDLNSVISLQLFRVLQTPTAIYFQLFCPSKNQTLEQIFSLVGIFYGLRVSVVF